jgi:NADH-quinone oxidoreductase subunit L
METMSGHMTVFITSLATLVPFAAFLVILIFTRSRPRLSAGLSVGAIIVSFVSALSLLILLHGIEKPLQYTARWMVAGGIEVPFGYLLDPLSVLMLVIVATICLLVQIYSLGYMAGDPGFSRYYAFMSLFAWAMMSLTVSPTMFQLYMFWELVGLASYLLIGFWYEKFSATQAGKKAFVMTRTGDVAFFIGLLLILLNLGNVGILDLNGPEAAALSPHILTLASLLIFGGIVGKSAQFPLMTWLPDAMEGPTPVSALLHSATMVAAGVYLFARLFPFFSLSPTAMEIFLAIGTISMLLSATMAIVSRDIKKVWAYSTISQLGFMIMALGAGSYFAGVFHLTTHAGFKALLFLCSGVFIHHFQTNDVFELGGLGSRKMKIPIISLAIGAAALSGIPPFSGYYSKEAIIGGLAGLENPFWLAAGLLGVFLTAYYTFRVIFILLLPKPGEAAHESSSGPHPPPHDSHAAGGKSDYWFMACPLIVLAAVTVLLGYFAEDPLSNFLVGAHTPGTLHEGGSTAWTGHLALGLAAAGVALALLEFGRPGASRIGFVERIPPLAKLFAERWYLDHLYRLLVGYAIDKGISRLCYENDNKVIDGSIDELCAGTVEGGRITAFLNACMIQYRLLTMFAVLVFLSLYFFF